MQNGEEEKRKKYAHILGIIAGLVTSFSLLPQVINCFLNKTATSLTIWTIVLFVIGDILWFSYGIVDKDKIIPLFSVVSFSIVLLLISTKLLFSEIKS